MESGGPDPEVEDKVMLKRHRVPYFLEPSLLRLPISLSPNTLKAMGSSSPSGRFQLLKSMFHSCPNNLENFYINRLRKLYSMFFEGYTEAVGTSPSQIR